MVPKLDDASALPGLSHQKKWATAEDWASYKETIIHLYFSRNFTLRQVVAIMRDKHEFFATWVPILSARGHFTWYLGYADLG